MTATVEFDNFTYENLLIHASPPPVKYSLRLRRYYLLTPWPECKGPWNRMTNGIPPPLRTPIIVSSRLFVMMRRKLFACMLLTGWPRPGLWVQH
jgi:hypothetical protein